MYEKLPEDPKGWLEPFSHVQKGTSEFSPDFLKFSIDLLGKNFRLLDKFYKNAKPEHQQGILYIMGPFFDAFNNPENFTKDKDWNTFLSALVTPPADDGDSLIYDSSSMEKAHDAL